MNSTKTRIELLKEAMTIEKERELLQQRLDRMVARLDQIKDAMFAGGGTKSAATVSVKRTGAARSAHGTLKQRVLDALATAGKAGVRVKDLALELGSTPATLHAWFQSARKKLRVIRKAGRGRYRLVGAVSGAAAAPVAKPARKAGKGKGAFKTNQRGQLTASILETLKAAGSKGARVGDMATRFGMQPRNLFVWFSTTAKKYKGIKKIGPGIYALKG